MKYLKSPMLSMSFSENKKEMKKRISNILSVSKKYSGNVCFWLIVMCVIIVGAFVGCNSKDENPYDDSTGKIFENDLENSVSNAIFSNNASKYFAGEISAEGHIILDSVEEKGNVVVYALTTYGEYGFENNIFTKVSGTGVIPTRIIFSKDDNGYSLVEYKIPKDGSKYMESIKKIFPDNLEKRVLKYTDEEAQNCYNQEYKYAKDYLNAIGRVAEVSTNIEKVLPNMNVDASNKFLDLFHEYPYWIGTQENIEHNVRFVYEKLWEDKGNGDGIVTFKKYRYDDKKIAEEYVIEIKEGKITYLTGNERTSRLENSVAHEYKVGEKINVDLDGDGETEEIYYGMDDFKINGVSYKKQIEDVYYDNPNRNYFIVVDMNKADKQKEIVLTVEGPSDDPAAHIYTYKNGLIKLGKAETLVNYTSFDGEGNLYGNVRLEVLQTWWAPEVWSLKDNKIERDRNHMYYPIQYNNGVVILLEDLPVYKNIDDNKTIGVIKPQKVKITKTDNKKYCYVEAADGSKGWFLLTNFFEMVDLDNKNATDVFEGLVMAD